MNSRRRVVITGLGALSPLGSTMRSTWAGVLEGRSGIGPITQFDVTDCPVKFAGEVKNYDPSAPLNPLYPNGDKNGTALTCAVPPKEVKKMGRFCCEARPGPHLKLSRPQGLKCSY